MECMHFLQVYKVLFICSIELKHADTDSVIHISYLYMALTISLTTSILSCLHVDIHITNECW